MERPQRRQERDINELLTNGFFKTSRRRSPSVSKSTFTDAPSWLQTATRNESARDRTRSRNSPTPRPPRPTVEDEVDSLAKESSNSSITSYDPPLRGIVDQHPIILEGDVTAAEAARLHAARWSNEGDENQERRFVLIPRSDTYSPNHEDEVDQCRGARDANEEGSRVKTTKRESERREAKKEPNPHAPRERRMSRLDLPSLETVVPKKTAPPFVRSSSANASIPRASDEAQKAATPRTPSNEYFLSPDVSRAHPKDYFTTQSAPRHQPQESFGGRAATPGSDKRSSVGSVSGASRPATPLSDKRNSGSFDVTSRSRRNTNEKLTRPQQLSGEVSFRKSDKHTSTHSDRLAAGSDRLRSSKSPAQSRRRYYSSSDDDIADSDSEKHFRRRRQDPQTQKGSRQDEEYDRHQRSPSWSNRSSLDVKPHSRYASPLASPKVSPSQIPRGDQFERSDTFPQTRDSRRPISRPISPLSADQETPRASDRLNPLEAAASPRTRSSQSTTIPTPLKKSQTTLSTTQGSLPIPIPTRIDLLSPGETRRSPSIPRFGDNIPNKRSSVSPKPNWQPPTFQPPPPNPEKPIGSYRRHSEEIERGSIVPLPPCPRTSFSRGRDDWLTLPQCPSFDICPSCFNSTIAPTEFRHQFVPSPRRSPDVDVQCDFGSSPWYRIAWLLTLKDRRRDLKLFYGLASIAANVQPCLGKHEAVRQWHSIIDPKVRAPIRNFDVCHSCVKSIETLLPSIRGIFVRSDSLAPAGAPRVCDLRFDSKRFIQYFDVLETTADQAEQDGRPADTRELAHLAKRLSLIDECPRDTEVSDRRWHIITQLPEFTVCEECFDEIVWPQLEQGKAIPAMFNKTLQRVPKAACQLYSPKMRSIFQTAVKNNDYKMLAAKGRERRTIETAYKANVAELKRQRGANPQAAAKEIARITDEWKKWE